MVVIDDFPRDNSFLFVSFFFSEMLSFELLLPSFFTMGSMPTQGELSRDVSLVQVEETSAARVANVATYYERRLNESSDLFILADFVPALTRSFPNTPICSGGECHFSNR